MPPRRADALAGLRIASPLHEKETPGAAPGVNVVWPLVEERPFQGRNLHTLVDIFAEKLICASPARDG